MKVVTREVLKKKFIKLGVKTGQDILIHTSMKKFGYFINGPYDILNSLYEIINLKKGTILIPTHTGQFSIPKFWKKKINSSIAAKSLENFDVKKSLPRNRGIISMIPLIDKRFRRSNHPLNSLSGIGKRSNYFTKSHPLQYPEGIGSPIWRLYKKKGYTLLFGVDLRSCSSIHLAEYIMDLNYLKNNKMHVFNNGKYVKIVKYPDRSNNFIRLMPYLKREKILKTEKLNGINIYFISIFKLVNLSIRILKKNNNFFR
mgnify:CR=1 FL=1